MSSNRKRNVQQILWLSHPENDVLLERMREAGIQNKQAYLRKMVLTGYILRLDMSEVQETLRLLGNATSNINQIAKRANETRSIYAADMINLQEEVRNMRSQVSDVIKVFGKIQDIVDVVKS